MEDFAGASALLEMASTRGSDEGIVALEQRYAEALKASRDKVGRLAGKTLTTLERARRQLYVTEDAYARLSGAQAQASDPERLDLGRALIELRVIGEELTSSKATEITKFREKVVPLCEANPKVAARIGTLVEAGDLATATELVELAEQGEELPEGEENAFELTALFPRIPAALKGGIDAQLVCGCARPGRDRATGFLESQRRCRPRGQRGLRSLAGLLEFQAVPARAPSTQAGAAPLGHRGFQ